MNTINKTDMLKELEEHQNEENEKEKRLREMLEKRLLEKQKQEKILEQLATETVETNQKNHNLDLLVSESKLLYVSQNNAAETHRKNVEQLYLKKTIEQLTQSIEDSIIEKLKTIDLKTEKSTAAEFTKQKPAAPVDAKKTIPIPPDPQPVIKQAKQTKQEPKSKPAPDSQKPQPSSTLTPIPIPTIKRHNDKQADEQKKRPDINKIKHDLMTGKTTPKSIAKSYVASVFNLKTIDKAKNKNQTTEQNQPLTKQDMLILGAAESDLSSLTHASELIIRNTLKQNLKQNLKQLAIQGLLSRINNTRITDTLTSNAMDSSYFSIMNALKSSRKLGDSDSINSLHESILEEAKDEVRYALEILIRQTKSDTNPHNSGHSDQSQNSDTTLDADTMIEAATSIGIIPNTHDADMQKSFTIDLFDLGHMVLDFGNPDQSDDSDSHNHGYAYTSDDEHNIILDRIRANLMQLAIAGSFIAGLIAKFKLTFNKRKGVQLGIYNKKTERMVSAEVNQQAIKTLQAMLDEALLEQASFHTESGTDWENNHYKIKSIIRNLYRLGVIISPADLSKRIAQANRAMTPIVELESASIQSVLNDHELPRAVYNALMERLAQIKRVHQRIQSTEPEPVQSAITPLSADQYRSICTNV